MSGTGWSRSSKKRDGARDRRGGAEHQGCSRRRRAPGIGAALGGDGGGVCVWIPLSTLLQGPNLVRDKPLSRSYVRKKYGLLPPSRPGGKKKRPFTPITSCHGPTYPCLHCTSVCTCQNLMFVAVDNVSVDRKGVP